MISAAFSFLGEFFPPAETSEKTLQAANSFKQKLTEGLERGTDGSLKMTIAFPDESALDNLANTLARMIGSAICGKP